MIPDPVPAFAALAHPQRLGVMRLLMRHHPFPVTAGAIAAALDLRASTLSGYLAQMMEAGLITQTRQGTSLHYGVALEAVAALNAAWIGGVCGGRGWPPVRRRAGVRTMVILGRGNAGPTLAAEAILRRLAGAAWEVFSAGTDPARAPDGALIAALDAAGHDVDPLFTKPLSLVTGPDMPQPDAVLVLGRTALEREPVWPGAPIRAHWRLPDDLQPGAMIADLGHRLSTFAALDPGEVGPSGLLAALDTYSAPHRISA